MMTRTTSELQKQLETYRQKLHASEERFRNIIDRNADAILIVSPEGVIRFVNLAAEEIFGRSAEGLVGQAFGFPMVVGEATEVDLVRAADGVVTAEMRVAETTWEGEQSKLVTLRDVTERAEAEEALRRLVKGTSSATGGPFFETLVREIAGWLGVRWSLVGEIDPLSPDTVNPLAFWSQGELESIPPYELEETPCQQAARKGFCLFPTGVADLFPDDAILKELGVEWYTGIPLRDSRGRAVGVLCALHDEPIEAPANLQEMLTIFSHRAGAEVVRKRIEKAVRESEQKLDSMLQTMVDGMVFVNPEGEITYANAAAERILEIRRDEILGRYYHEREWQQIDDDGQPYPSDQLPLFIALRERRAVEGLEHGIVAPSGETKWLSVNAAPMPSQNGHPQGAVASFRDITEQKRMEETLRLRDAAMATSINAIAMFDLDGQLTYANDAFLDLWGYECRETLLKRPSNEFWRRPEQIAAAINALEERGRWRGELIAQRADGTPFHVQAAISIVTRNGGDPIAIMASFVDITERRRMEQALRESEERFRSIVEQSHDGIVLVDQEGRIAEWNKGEEQIMGLPQDEVLGRFLWDVQYQLARDERKRENPELRTLLRKTVLSYLREDQTPWLRQLSEREIERPDGTRRIVQSSIFPIQTSEGPMVGSITRDITDQQRMEERLRKLSRAVEQSPAAVVITDTAGNIEYVNPKFTQITGYAAEELIGCNPRILKSGRHPAEFYETLWDTITSGEEWRGEFCNRDKSGEIYWESASISPVRDSEGRTTHYIKVAEDVTARREMEEALRHSEQRYRTLFDHAGDAIFVHDLEARFLDVNQIACERLGYSREEMLQMTPMEISTQEGASTMERIEQLKEADRIVFETTQVRRDGTHIPVEISSRYIEYDGQPAVLSIARDISERKEAEERIAHYAADLERSNRELEQFGYVISHDLQEPLRMVTSYLRLLERRYSDQLDAKAEEFIDYAVDGASRMSKMIKALLDLSRVDTRGQDLAPTDSETVLKRTLDALQRAIEESNALVTHEPLPTVMADESQLGQVFQNLVANAIKFRRNGEAPHIHISAEPRNGHWLFIVEDNGIGIDPEQADRIFEIFQRLHTRQEYPGVGIGLALCKRIVERHGGRIWVESEPDEGSTFYFTLPA